MEGNAIHDPCFSMPDRQRVICGANPAVGKNGFALRLTKPSPNDDTAPVPARENWGWLIKLGDGALCTPFTGTRPFVAGEVAFYGCTSKKTTQQTLLLGDLDNSNPSWTARKVTLVKSGAGWAIKAPEVVPIKAVWQ
jgi:hypothetical protein